jgi:hypothetical protein
MLRYIIEHHSFGGLLGMAAGYSTVAILCVLLLADGVVRDSMLWRLIISTAARLVN